jgi:hypothetical protein
MRIEASPHVATPHDRILEITSVKVFSAATYQNECSMATARVSFACTSGAQEFSNVTLPRRAVFLRGLVMREPQWEPRAAQRQERACGSATS